MLGTVYFPPPSSSDPKQALSLVFLRDLDELNLHAVSLLCNEKKLISLL